MPGMDRTGPLGTGSLGRGMGPCGGGKSGCGRGNMFNRGNRQGWNSTFTPVSPEEEKTILEQHKAWLETQLTIINEKLQG